ncbi:site-specific integrase [Flavobacterium psychrophilum]|uniref:site-specific integrase n=1 Tax=Flavobacterium psychrophilum TaxID=96345 RepID=UPI00193348F1|nr:site-specific integrase [Flavobacterium psychrophilum]QRE13617.1 site-specific integrase [Flavobacterium psychrophilum]
MKTTISILFYLKRAKANSKGLVPIFQRITVNGKRIDKSTSKFIDPLKWSIEGGKMKGNSEEARTVNSHLVYLKSKVLDAENNLQRYGGRVLAETIKNKLNGFDERDRMLIPIFQNHNDKMEALLGQEYAPGTLERYKTSLKHTKDFIKWKYNLSDINILKIDYAFVAEYDFYFRSVCKCSNNTTVKYVKNFMKIIRICLANDWIQKDPFINYKATTKEVDRFFLTEEQIFTIANKQLHTQRLNQVRDAFLFSCYTGLAYVDVKNLSKDNISMGIDGEKWIFTNRQKTKVQSNIPLLPFAEEMIEKYKNNPKCLNEGKLLPILSNQRTNSYLKEIADLCGIDKELTFHIARHTFATTILLNNGIPMESASKMLGHTSIKTTQHYAKILNKKVSDDMKILKEKFAAKMRSTDNEISLIKIN